jgi:hypothetical protein
MAQQPPQDDPFDTLLTLEDTLYQTAYTLGASDGSHAGRIEGRIFGLEKGFEKFAELGDLHGRSVVWGARLPCLTSHQDTSVPSSTASASGEGEKANVKELTPLPNNDRLKNNITLLHSLTDPPTFSTSNTEEAVADYDDRFKRAGAKVKVIERIVGESAKSHEDGSSSPARGKKGGPVRVMGEKSGKNKSGKGDDSMEDFVGGKGVRGG